MPYRFYFGKTGRVWNVNKRSVGGNVENSEQPETHKTVSHPHRAHSTIKM